MRRKHPSQMSDAGGKLIYQNIGKQASTRDENSEEKMKRSILERGIPFLLELLL